MPPTPPPSPGTFLPAVATIAAPTKATAAQKTIASTRAITEFAVFDTNVALLVKCCQKVTVQPRVMMYGTIPPAFI